MRSWTLSFLLVCCLGMLMPAGAQAQHYDPKHIHSIEITSGVPPLRAIMFGPGNPDSRLYWEYEDKGQAAHEIWIPSINLAYSVAVDELWDLHVIVNYSCMRVHVSQFTIVEDSKPHPVVDWKSGPVASWKETIRSSFAVMFDFRLKWFRRDWGALYSALGLGFPLTPMKPAITPYVTPIGFRAGGKHVYGLIELNLSSAATLGMAGVGFRF